MGDADATKEEVIDALPGRKLNQHSPIDQQQAEASSNASEVELDPPIIQLFSSGNLLEEGQSSLVNLLENDPNENSEETTTWTLDIPQDNLNQSELDPVETGFELTRKYASTDISIKNGQSSEIPQSLTNKQDVIEKHEVVSKILFSEEEIELEKLPQKDVKVIRIKPANISQKLKMKIKENILTKISKKMEEASLIETVASKLLVRKRFKYSIVRHKRDFKTSKKSKKGTKTGKELKNCPEISEIISGSDDDILEVAASNKISPMKEQKQGYLKMKQGLKEKPEVSLPPLDLTPLLPNEEQNIYKINESDSFEIKSQASPNMPRVPPNTPHALRNTSQAFANTLQNPKHLRSKSTDKSLRDSSSDENNLKHKALDEIIDVLAFPKKESIAANKDYSSDEEVNNINNSYINSQDEDLEGATCLLFHEELNVKKKDSSSSISTDTELKSLQEEQEQNPYEFQEEVTFIERKRIVDPSKGAIPKRKIPKEKSKELPPWKPIRRGLNLPSSMVRKLISLHNSRDDLANTIPLLDYPFNDEVKENQLEKFSIDELDHPYHPPFSCLEIDMGRIRSNDVSKGKYMDTDEAQVEIGITRAEREKRFEHAEAKKENMKSFWELKLDEIILKTEIDKRNAKEENMQKVEETGTASKEEREQLKDDRIQQTLREEFVMVQADKATVIEEAAIIGITAEDKETEQKLKQDFIHEWVAKLNLSQDEICHNSTEENWFNTENIEEQKKEFEKISIEHENEISIYDVPKLAYIDTFFAKKDKRYLKTRKNDPMPILREMEEPKPEPSKVASPKQKKQKPPMAAIPEGSEKSDESD